MTEEGLRKLKMMGFTDARLGALTGRDEANVRPCPPEFGRHRRVQADRYLRRRVRGADALYVFHLRGPDDGRGWSARRAPPTARRW